MKLLYWTVIILLDIVGFLSLWGILYLIDHRLPSSCFFFAIFVFATSVLSAAIFRKR